ncbi:hypothetical protein [Acidaminobacter sp.]|uniref:hypothetical protein n=1 Tax=Acidaminobacter sp. TaxID=1872102 RepID=UPI00255FBB53|nr:hypothetical protein [Acidaminobacter sp.]MDK9710962.1 hypothetical protein [Acidaminobacter sp.]
MFRVLNATDVRKHWSEFVDDVIRNKPAFVKRNRDLLAVLSMDQMDALLESLKIRINIVQEEDGSFTGVLNELELAANEETIDQLKETLIEDLIEYAAEYMQNFDLYFKSPNRKSHFPYVYKINSMTNTVDRLREEVELYQVVKNNA